MADGELFSMGGHKHVLGWYIEPYQVYEGKSGKNQLNPPKADS